MFHILLTSYDFSTFICIPLTSYLSPLNVEYAKLQKILPKFLESLLLYDDNY